MENNTNRTEKKKGRFNVIDVLVIVILLLVAFVTAWILDPIGLFPNDTQRDMSIRYTVEMSEIDDELAELIATGDGVTDQVSGKRIGTVALVERTQAYVWEYSEAEGTMVKKSISGKSDLIITIESECVYEYGKGYSVNGVQIAYGTPISLRSQSFSGSGYCVSFDEIR